MVRQPHDSPLPINIYMGENAKPHFTIHSNRQRRHQSTIPPIDNIAHIAKYIETITLHNITAAGYGTLLPIIHKAIATNTYKTLLELIRISTGHTTQENRTKY